MLTTIKIRPKILSLKMLIVKERCPLVIMAPLNGEVKRQKTYENSTKILLMKS